MYRNVSEARGVPSACARRIFVNATGGAGKYFLQNRSPHAPTALSTSRHPYGSPGIPTSTPPQHAMPGRAFGREMVCSVRARAADARLRSPSAAAPLMAATSECSPGCDAIPRDRIRSNEDASRRRVHREGCGQQVSSQLFRWDGRHYVHSRPFRNSRAFMMQTG